MGSSFDPNRRRLAKEIYWNLRRCARSVRAYMTDQFSGKRSGVLFQELYLAAENVDLLVSDAWNQGGTTAVNYLLDTSDVCEHCLCRIAAEVSFLLTGDSAMRDEMRSCRPPGGSHLMPDHEVIRSREISKQQHLQRQRVGGRGATDGGDDSDDPPKRARRRRGRGKGGDQGQGQGQGKGGAAAKAAK